MGVDQTGVEHSQDGEESCKERGEQDSAPAHTGLLWYALERGVRGAKLVIDDVGLRDRKSNGAYGAWMQVDDDDVGGIVPYPGISQDKWGEGPENWTDADGAEIWGESGGQID